jgi:hypothetical protein
MGFRMAVSTSIVHLVFGARVGSMLLALSPDPGAKAPKAGAPQAEGVRVSLMIL